MKGRFMSLHLPSLFRFFLLARLLFSTCIKTCISHLRSREQSLLRTRAIVNVGVITTFCALLHDISRYICSV